MSHIKIESKSNKAESHDEKQIRSSQHFKNKKNMADKLRGEIDTLMEKQRKAKTAARQSVEEHQYYKAKGKDYEGEAEFHWLSFRTWSDENRRLAHEIQVKLKAVQVFEQPSKKMEEPKIMDKKEQQMKYGPSDEEQ